MRFLLSTVAATALMATPALAQTLENDVTEAPEAADPLAPGAGIDFTQLEQDLTGAGFADARELHGAEIYRSTYQGQDALVIILEEDFGPGVAMADEPFDDPAVTEAIPEDDDLMDDDLAADPAFPEDDELAETPADPAFPQDDDLAEAPADPAFPEDDDLAEAPEIDDPAFEDPDVTAAIPDVGVEDELSQAGFAMPERTAEGQVFRTTTEDGRTMLIVMGHDATVDPMGPADPEFAPEEPDLEMEEIQ